MKKTLLVAVLITVNALAFGGEISDYHSKNAQNALSDYRNSRSHAEVEFVNHGIKEIGIERGPCYGFCPIYTFVVKSDGTFRYNGVKNVERQGKFSGTVPVRDFHALAQFIRDSAYMDLEVNYMRTVTDNPTTYTMVVMNGKRKTIGNYARAGPTKLWAIEELIDGLMSKAKWDARGPQEAVKRK